MKQKRFYIEIFLISFVTLFLEISYTRLISFKLFYYYTYVVIGFALLGIGAGGVFVAIIPRLSQMRLTRLVAAGCFLASITVQLGYFAIALTMLNTHQLWLTSNWLASGAEVAKLLFVCFALFATFATVGVMIAALLSRNPETVNRLYFADLLGAGFGCALVIPLITVLSPPACIFVGAMALGAVSLRLAYREFPRLAIGAGVSICVASVLTAVPRWLPDPVTDKIKTIRPETATLFSQWGPVFRIDVTRLSEEDSVRIIHHDGLWGSTLQRFNGDVSSLTRFANDPRAYAFEVSDVAPRNVLIIGAAGGHEILAALYFEANNVTAVELNPITVSLLREHFVDYTGNLGGHPNVTLINDEGRSFLSRQDQAYDLIFFVAPDSYSAMNAATAGAFVLSESYLYTTEMLVASLKHLTDDGIICMQFGEFAYDRKPNRTARYVGTARAALARLGIAAVGEHILVATTPDIIQLSTIILKRTPFSRSEVENFLKTTNAVLGSNARHAWGQILDDGPVNTVIALDDTELDAWYSAYPYDIRPIFDDAPFFWHFARFRSVLAEFNQPRWFVDPEDSLGERLLVIMIVISGIFAFGFLLLPFVAIRNQWKALPRKGLSFGYFAGIGLGFMFFEICLMQKLTLFLGYPTYSVTVTLLSLLVFAGIGSLATSLYLHRRDTALGVLLCAIVALTLFYQFGITTVTDRLLGSPLAIRILVAMGMIAPLGITLGAFMPLGLATVSALTDRGTVYAAWGWAVNGFFSVMGSVLTTALSMTYGFRVVLLLGLVTYTVAVFLLRSIPYHPVPDRAP
jgi:hypothetical protein